ncbi:MAG: hypothetical protein HQL46_00890 [Gammaproteobacteria bacterium]|nr:hypothetical protein [Gammaproteobacteria bacterium]
MDYIRRYDDTMTFSTDERCFINELLNTKDDENCSIAKAIVDIGVSTQLHAVKDTIERYVIIQGQGDVEINHQQATHVSYLDVVMIPAGQAQKITNTGTEALVILCICTPRFKQENYINLEINEEYTPVSCQVHSELELAVMHQEKLNVQISDTENIFGLATDIVTKDKCEYLKIKDTTNEIHTIRLDKISRFNIIK